MTTTSTIITAAYRESNFSEAGGTLTDDENNEALALLQSLVYSFHPTLVDLKYRPWHVPRSFETAPDRVQYPARSEEVPILTARENQYPPSNSRVFLRNTTTQTIYLQYEPEDGAVMQFVDAGFQDTVTIDGNGMFIGDGVDYTTTLTEAFTGGSRVPKRTYLFRADLGAWKQLDDLVLTTEFPFPPEFDDYFITALAMRLAPRFGNMPNQVTMLRNKDMMTLIRGIYRQTTPVLVGNPGERTDQNYYNQGTFGDPDNGGIR